MPLLLLPPKLHILQNAAPGLERETHIQKSRPSLNFLQKIQAKCLIGLIDWSASTTNQYGNSLWGESSRWVRVDDQSWLTYFPHADSHGT